MGCALQSAGIGHPWPDVIPSSRFGQRPEQPVYYEQADPSVGVEVTADAAFELYRWRHPTTFVRLRLDLRPEDCSV